MCEAREDAKTLTPTKVTRAKDSANTVQQSVRIKGEDYNGHPCLFDTAGTSAELNVRHVEFDYRGFFFSHSKGFERRRYR